MFELNSPTPMTPRKYIQEGKIVIRQKKHGRDIDVKSSPNARPSETPPGIKRITRTPYHEKLRPSQNAF